MLVETDYVDLCQCRDPKHVGRTLSGRCLRVTNVGAGICLGCLDECVED
jgi:hypothetical protein